MARAQKSNERGLLSRIAGGAGERMLNVVDPNQVLDHVDVNALLDRVDVNRLLDRVDVDALLERADVDALMERVDVNALVNRAGIPEIVRESTGHLTGSALDLGRRPLVGLDLIITRALNRLIGRDQSEFPAGPSELVEWVDRRDPSAVGVKTGRYAGPLTRLLAVVVDGFVITFSFTLMVGVTEFVLSRFGVLFRGADVPGTLYGALLGAWGFVYLLASLAIAGKTVGKALLGLRVVTAEGDPALRQGQALIRVLTYPLSFALFGAGLLGIVFGRQRRAWHDRMAGTAVVYDWGSRTATLPTPLTKFLERKQVETEEE